jgi:triosephosphate isomerase (TIM)
MMAAVRPVIVAGNWKMHTTPGEAGELAAAIAALIDEPSVTRVLCPPFIALGVVGQALAGSGIEVGAQNVHHEVEGPFTGEVSAPMLEGLATWVICGHSERRRDACETDEQIGRKVGRALAFGLRPILAVGERLEERETGAADRVVRSQLHGALQALNALNALDALPAAIDERARPLVIAYEPVWAIGTGRTAHGADAAAMAGLIRETLAEAGWGSRAESVPVLYGGSVTAANIAEFVSEPAIDGALVGGASLKPDEMAGIVARAALTARARAGVAAAARTGP